MNTKILLTYEKYECGTCTLHKEIRSEERYYKQCGEDDNDRFYFYNTNKEDFIDEFFNFELMWQIKKLHYIHPKLLKDIKNSNAEYRNVYLTMLKNSDNTYLESVEYVSPNELVVDMGLAFENEFYTIHNIELMHINTGKIKRAYAYLDKVYIHDTRLSVVEIIENYDYFNNNYVSQKISEIEDVLQDIKNYIKKESNDVKAKEDLLRIEKEKEYLTNQFLIDINTAKSSFII